MRELITYLHLRSKKLACPQSMRVLTAFTLLLIAGQATAGEQVISVQHDSQRGVTYWILNNTGISCLPDSQLQQQATPSSETGRAFPASSERKNVPLVAGPPPGFDETPPAPPLQNQPTLAPEQDQDGPTPVAVPLRRQYKETFQL